MIVGDITLWHVAKTDLIALRKAGLKYDDALRRAGIARQTIAEDRNLIYGEVYEARKAFSALLDKCSGDVLEQTEPHV